MQTANRLKRTLTECDMAGSSISVVQGGGTPFGDRAKRATGNGKKVTDSTNNVENVIQL